MTGIDFGPQAEAVQVIIDAIPHGHLDLIALCDENFWSAWRVIEDVKREAAAWIPDFTHTKCQGGGTR